MRRIQYNSPVVLTFALISLAVLGLDHITGGISTRLFFMTYRAPLTDPLMYVRLFGHVLGHAGFAHYAGNMTLFLVVGPMLEEKYGSRSILEMILVTALVSGIIHNLFFPGSALLGASGIVFMMIILASQASAERGRIPLTFILVSIVYIGSEIMQNTAAADNVSHITHIIGGICGAAFGFISNHGRRGY
jgi:rhomboid protease GluP